MNPIVALIIANLIWGMASPLFKFALTNIPPFTLAFIRFFGAAIIFLPFVKWKTLFELSARNWWEIILGSAFLGIFVNIAFFFLGLQRTTSINAPIIASCGPLILFVFSVFFLKEKPSRRVFGGMLIAFAGAMAIIFAPIMFDGKRLADLQKFEGNLFFVIATLGSVLSTLVLKNVLKKISSLLVTVLGFLFSAFGFLPLMMGELHTWHWSQLNGAGLTGIIFGVFFSSALAYFLYNYGLSKIAAQEVGVFTYIDPVAAILIAAPLLHEYPNWIFVIGSSFVFIGILIAEKRLHYHPVYRIKKHKFPRHSRLFERESI